MRALLDGCQGHEFVQLRDTAIIRRRLDSGGRLGEIAELTLGTSTSTSTSSMRSARNAGHGHCLSERRPAPR